MALPAAVVAALISSAPAALKGIQGIFQGIKGKKMAKANVRPTYQIPTGFAKNLAEAEAEARTGLPQQQYNRALQNIQRNQSAGLRQIGRMGRGGSVAGLARAGMDAGVNLDVADAEARARNRQMARGYRTQLSQQELAKQAYDKFGKYEEDAAAAEALMGAGRQNVMGGLSDLSRVGMTYMSGDDGSGKKGSKKNK
jgi:hypothetical protein